MKTSIHQDDEYDRLKTELRRLKRAGAPWYFESELHQRLHGGHARQHRHRLRPFGMAPAFAIAVVAFCSLAVAAYVMLINSDLFLSREPWVQPPAPASLSPPVDSTLTPMRALSSPGVSPAAPLPRNTSTRDVVTGGDEAEIDTSVQRSAIGRDSVLTVKKPDSIAVRSAASPARADSHAVPPDTLSPASPGGRYPPPPPR